MHAAAWLSAARRHAAGAARSAPQLPGHADPPLDRAAAQPVVEWRAQVRAQASTVPRPTCMCASRVDERPPSPQVPFRRCCPWCGAHCRPRGSTVAPGLNGGCHHVWCSPGLPGRPVRPVWCPSLSSQTQGGHTRAVAWLSSCPVFAGPPCEACAPCVMRQSQHADPSCPVPQPRGALSFDSLFPADTRGPACLGSDTRHWATPTALSSSHSGTSSRSWIWWWPAVCAGSEVARCSSMVSLAESRCRLTYLP